MRVPKKGTPYGMASRIKLCPMKIKSSLTVGLVKLFQIISRNETVGKFIYLERFIALPTRCYNVLSQKPLLIKSQQFVVAFTRNVS